MVISHNRKPFIQQFYCYFFFFNTFLSSTRSPAPWELIGLDDAEQFLLSQNLQSLQGKTFEGEAIKTMWDEATSGIDFLYELNSEKPYPAKIWSRWRGRSPSARFVNRAANKKYIRQEKGNNITLCKELKSISPVDQTSWQNTNKITTQTQNSCIYQKGFFYQAEIAFTSFYR